VNLAGWITFLGVVITAVFGLVGAWASARAHRLAATRAAETEQMQMQLTARDNQIEAWRTDVQTLRRDRAEDEARCREQIAALAAQVDALMANLRAHGAPIPDPPVEIGETGADGEGGAE
jgi:phosphoserine phosphatase